MTTNLKSTKKLIEIQNDNLIPAYMEELLKASEAILCSVDEPMTPDEASTHASALLHIRRIFEDLKG